MEDPLSSRPSGWPVLCFLLKDKVRQKVYLKFSLGMTLVAALLHTANKLAFLEGNSVIQGFFLLCMDS